MDLAEFIWNSNMIENIDRFDLAGTRHIVEACDNQNAIEFHRDAVPYIMHHYAAWKEMERTVPLLTADHILKIHGILMEGQLEEHEVGSFRVCRVMVGGHIPPGPDKVSQLLEKLLEAQEDMTPKEWHVEFEKIHPFVDGNGRLGRIIGRWMGMEDVRFENRQEYYGWFH